MEITTGINRLRHLILPVNQRFSKHMSESCDDWLLSYKLEYLFKIFVYNINIRCYDSK